MANMYGERLEDIYHQESESSFNFYHDDLELAEMLEQENQEKIELMEQYYAQVNEECN